MSKQNDKSSTEDMLNDLLGPDFMATGAGKPKAASMEAPLPSEDMDLATESDSNATDESLAETEPATRRRRARSSAKATESQARSEKTGIGAMVGAACLMGGIVATVLQSSSSLTTSLRSVGLDAPVLLTIGAVLFVLSVVRRQHTLAQARYEQLAQAQNEKESELQGSVQYLVEQHQLSTERPPAEGEELQRVLLALERQDEKVGNLTKALKMYGKPLMEIAQQGNDLAAQLQQQKQQIEAIQATMQQGLAKVESAAKSLSVDLTPLEQSFQKLAADLKQAITAVAEKAPQDPQLMQALQRVETSIASIGKRLDDGDMKQSLTRLEDTSKAYGQKLERLANQDTLHEEMQRLERVVDTTVGKLTNTVDQVRDKDLGGLENSVREIQREVTGLANSVASIQQAIRTSAQQKAPAMAAASVAHEAAHAPSQSPSPAPAGNHEPAAHAQPTTGNAPAAPGSSSDAQAGVAENRTGTRAASGKNVLGAIAKLKQMKG
jgi:ABC-type transporter Mla subunit MlaD